MFIVTVYKILVQQFLNNDWFGWFMVFNTISAIFQLYRDGPFYWWRTPEYSEKTTDLSQVTNILNNDTCICIYMALKNVDIHTMISIIYDTPRLSGM
jgi:hypothetical protein